MRSLSFQDYRARLFQLLEPQGITHTVIARLWRVGMRNIEVHGQLSRALNSGCFEEPRRLELAGCDGQIDPAVRTAEVVLQESVRTIRSLVDALDRLEAEIAAAEAQSEATAADSASDHGVTPEHLGSTPTTGLPPPKKTTRYQIDPNDIDNMT